MAVSIFAAIPNADAQERDPAAVGRPAGAVSQPPGARAYGQLTARDTVGDILRHPALQAAALKVAREELQKAIALIERTKWKPYRDE